MAVKKSSTPRRKRRSPGKSRAVYVRCSASTPQVKVAKARKRKPNPSRRRRSTAVARRRRTTPARRRTAVARRSRMSGTIRRSNPDFQLILKRTAFDGGALLVGSLAAVRFNQWFDTKAGEMSWDKQATGLWKILGGLGILGLAEYAELAKSERPMGNFVDDVDLRLVGVGVSAMALTTGLADIQESMQSNGAGNGTQTPVTEEGTMIRTTPMGRRMRGSMGATYLPGMPSRMQGSLMMDRDRAPVSSMQGYGMRATPSRMQGRRGLI